MHGGQGTEATSTVHKQAGPKVSIERIQSGLAPGADKVVQAMHGGDAVAIEALEDGSVQQQPADADQQPADNK